MYFPDFIVYFYLSNTDSAFITFKSNNIFAPLPYCSRICCQYYALNVSVFSCYTISHDKKVNIQEPRGGTRDPYFTCSQPIPPPPPPPPPSSVQARLSVFSSRPPSFCDCVLLWKKKKTQKKNKTKKPLCF